MNNDEISKKVDNLILEGGIEFAGINKETGEMLYSFTPKIKELMPDLYREHLNLVNFELMQLWEKGYVIMNLLEEDPLISLSTKAFDENEIKKLSKQEKWSLEELKRVIISKEL